MPGLVVDLDTRTRVVPILSGREMHFLSATTGSYKNLHSRHTVTINVSREAQEMVMLASHLLRIVEAGIDKE